MARLDPGLPSAQQLVYSTFLGGGSDDYPYALSVDATGVATLVGFTGSANFPTTPGAWGTTFNGVNDAFLTRLDMLPTGARMFGTSSPGCNGPLAIGVTSMPRIGKLTFMMTCNNAPPLTTGVLLLGARGLASPIRVLGVDVWVDPTGAWFLSPPASSNHLGAAYFALPLPQNPWLVNQEVDAQFVWLGPHSAPSCSPLGVSASNALEITIQSHSRTGDPPGQRDR